MIFSVESFSAILSWNNQVCNFWWLFWNGEGALGRHFTIPYFFSTPQNDLKKITHQKSWWFVPVENKIRIFGSLLSILISTFWFQHMYKVVPNQTSFINLVNSGIFSRLCDFIDLLLIGKLHKSSFISMVMIIKIILHEWGITLVTWVRQENKSYAHPPRSF